MAKKYTKVISTTFNALSKFRDYVEGKITLKEFRECKAITTTKTFYLDENGNEILD